MMDEKDWSIAHEIAFELVDKGTDANEVANVYAFLRQHRNREQFFILLNRLINSGRALVRSKRTLDYYRNIQDACNRHLKDISDIRRLAEILGWTVRLMRFYKFEPRETRGQKKH
jgi:hypothetical protein